RVVLTRYIGGMTDQLAGIFVLLYEGALSPSHYQQIMEQREEYQRSLSGLVRVLRPRASDAPLQPGGSCGQVCTGRRAGEGGACDGSGSGAVMTEKGRTAANLGSAGPAPRNG